MRRPFWYVRPDWPPWPPVTGFEQVRLPGPELLSMTWGHAGYGMRPAEKRRAIQSWSDVLPSLTGVRFLWIASKVSQSMFDILSSMESLEGLHIHHSSIENLRNLSRMRSLRHFHLGSSTALESIEPLRQLTQLRTLGLENLKRIQDIEPLGALRQLEELSLDGSMWTTQRVTTLAPLEALTQLRVLSLTNLRAGDRSLKPLFALSKLECFVAARWWDADEVAEIVRRNPGVETGD